MQERRGKRENAGTAITDKYGEKVTTDLSSADLVLCWTVGLLAQPSHTGTTEG